ncbi:hypothetical protein SHDE107825_05575 [Shewanella denitrificans]
MLARNWVILLLNLPFSLTLGRQAMLTLSLY